MLLVGCSRRLPSAGRKTTAHAVTVHEVVEDGENSRGGGELLSCPQLWKVTASPGRRFCQRIARGVGAHGGNTVVGGIATVAAAVGGAELRGMDRTDSLHRG